MEQSWIISIKSDQEKKTLLKVNGSLCQIKEYLRRLMSQDPTSRWPKIEECTNPQTGELVSVIGYTGSAYYGIDGPYYFQNIYTAVPEPKIQQYEIFESPNQMLERIKSGESFFNKKTGEYVFLHDEAGSIMSFKIKYDDALRLRAKAITDGEDTRARVGLRGKLRSKIWVPYASDGKADRDEATNIHYCIKHYEETDWIKCENIV